MNVFKQRFCQLVLHEELNVSPSDVYVASFFSIYFWLYVNLRFIEKYVIVFVFVCFSLMSLDFLLALLFYFA